MAQSQVDVWNSALQRLGASPVLSVTDSSKNARQMGIAYDSNRRAELRKHRWNFARKRVQLAPDVAAPAFDYLYQFTLPTDCLRVLLPNDACNDWATEGRKILTNAGTTLDLVYIADITDVTQWDATFYDLVAISMAMDTCEAITTSPGKKQVLQAEYKDALMEARRANAFEVLPAEAVPDTFWTVRL